MDAVADWFGALGRSSEDARAPQPQAGDPERPARIRDWVRAAGARHDEALAAARSPGGASTSRRCATTSRAWGRRAAAAAGQRRGMSASAGRRSRPRIRGAPAGRAAADSRRGGSAPPAPAARTPRSSEQASTVVLDGEGRQHQPGGDLGVRQPLREERRDLALARGHPVGLEPERRRPVRRGESADHDRDAAGVRALGQGRVQRDPAVRPGYRDDVGAPVDVPVARAGIGGQRETPSGVSLRRLRARGPGVRRTAHGPERATKASMSSDGPRTTRPGAAGSSGRRAASKRTVVRMPSRSRRSSARARPRPAGRSRPRSRGGRSADGAPAAPPAEDAISKGMSWVSTSAIARAVLRTAARRLAQDADRNPPGRRERRTC